jgi:hypothetical protein
MNRHFTRVAAAALMAITLSGQSVRAQGNDFWSWLHPWGAQDWRLTATSIGLGAGATAGYFALRK